MAAPLPSMTPFNAAAPESELFTQPTMASPIPSCSTSTPGLSLSAFDAFTYITRPRPACSTCAASLELSASVLSARTEVPVPVFASEKRDVARRRVELGLVGATVVLGAEHEVVHGSRARSRRPEQHCTRCCRRGRTAEAQQSASAHARGFRGRFGIHRGVASHGDVRSRLRAFRLAPRAAAGQC